MNGLPSKPEAEALLAWGETCNPGPWAEHSRVTARAAEAIAQRCGLQAGEAYVLGLLHDIGRYEGVRDLHHVVAGYRLMAEKGYPRAARVCLTHSFPYRDLAAYSGKQDCTAQELAFLSEALGAAAYDRYDQLIQLCDAICLPRGVCLLQVRLVDVARRHGVTAMTLPKWEATFALKSLFDSLCGSDIYGLFFNEIHTVSFQA